MAQAKSITQTPSSQRLMLLLGLLWLLMAAAIVISQFARPTPIRIEWETETEVDTAGFNIYRASSADGDFSRINEQLIPGEGGPSSGASYEYVDRDVEPGQVYFYQLEDVELDNSAERHEIIEFEAPLAPWWAAVTAAISVLAGLVLLVRGLRTDRQ